MSFELTLKDDRQRKLYSRITLMILVLNLAYFIFGFTAATDPEKSKWFLFGAIAILLITLFTWWRNKKQSAMSRGYGNVYVPVIFTWVVLGNWLFAAAHAVLLILDMKAVRDIVIRFTSEYIFIKGLSTRRINWNDVGNVILKDGMLTIDLKNNKMMQVPVREDWEKPEEDNFNRFCKEQMAGKQYVRES